MKTLFQNKHTAPDPELLALKDSLARAQEELLWAYCQFNEAVDPELIDSCIYEISAVKARCNYLIRAIKARTPAAAAGEDTQWI